MKKANNLILLALLAGLLLVFVGLRFFRSPGLERNMPEHLTDLDTAVVTSIDIVSHLYPDQPVQLVRSGKKWELKSGTRTGRLEPNAGQMALRTLSKLSPQRILSKKPDKWKEFGVSDSLGTMVKVMKGKEVVADLVIGKTGYVQNPQGGFGGGYTHVRVAGQNEVFAVDGFLDAQFNKRFNDWRDKSLVRINRDSVDRITFQYPDSSFVLSKSGGKWMVDQVQADSVATFGYLMGMSYKNISDFSEEQPAGKSQATVVFYKGQNELSRVDGWFNGENWTLQSTLQPETFFRADPKIAKDILKGKNGFLRGSKKK